MYELNGPKGKEKKFIKDKNFKSSITTKNDILIIEKERLPRTNRLLQCNYCNSNRILNPDQYQSYFDYWLDEEKIQRNFICKPCEMSMQENQFRFYLFHSELTRKLIKEIKAIFEKYRKSRKTNTDVNNMSYALMVTAGNNKLFVGDFNSNCEYIIDPAQRLIVGLKVKNFPFVGAVEIRPYEKPQISIL